MSKKILATLTILLTLAILAVPVQASYSITFGTPSKDTTIYSNIIVDQNYGGYYDLEVGDSVNIYGDVRSLVQFDLPPALSFVTITSATLTLWGPTPWSGSEPSGQVVRVCRVTQDWVEGTGSWSAPAQDGVTWNEYNYFDGLTTATNNWATPGGDYTLTDSATATMPSYPLPSDVQSWTVTDIVKGWVNGDYPNYGFLIKFDDESLVTAKGGVFASKEDAGGRPSPALEITYTMDPDIESCDSTGAIKDTFDVTDDVYATGTGYMPQAGYSIYLVEDVTWVDGMAIPPRVPGTETVVISDASGNIPPTLLWSAPVTPGKYDILVAAHYDDVYNSENNALDDNDIEVTAGFLVTTAEHDVSADAQIASATEIMPGDLVDIDVTVANNGDFTETFDLACYYDSVDIGTILVVDLAPGESRVVKFTWDTTAVPMNGYAITAWADSSEAIVEVDEANNWCTMPLNVFVVPELPLGTILATLSMLAALVGYVGFKRYRTK